MLNENEKARKKDGRECQVYNCQEPNPQHKIIWRCVHEHEEVNWYCAGHIEYMTDLALCETGTQFGNAKVLPTACSVCGYEGHPVVESRN